MESLETEEKIGSQLLDDPLEIEHPNNTPENAHKYSLSTFENTYYLGYRDVPLLLQKYALGNKAIDYGCGTGRSTRFLKACGFETIGVDISKEMLTHALTSDNSSHYIHIRSGQIPVVDSSYDVAFSCFVFLTISTKQEILSILNEIHRCLKKDGIFIIVTGSEELYRRDWLSYDVQFPENKKLKSGNVARIKLKDLGVEFINYYWQDADYAELFEKAGFQLVEKCFPLGKPGERNDWHDEAQYPPYAIYVLQKN